MAEAVEFSLSTRWMELILRRQGSQLRFEQRGLGARPGPELLASSGVFRVQVNQQAYSIQDLGYRSGACIHTAPGRTHFQACLEGPGFEVELHLAAYADTALFEIWPVIHNTGSQACRISRVDSFSFDLPAAGYELMSFSSDWGQEFQPEQRQLAGEMTLETRLGRSSKGMHPWFGLRKGSEGLLCGAIAWSGNWKARFEPLAGGGYRISGGLSDWNFVKDLALFEKMEGPACILALGDDLNGVSRQFARVGRQFWYPHNPLSARMPVEWNHWWSYEDVEINDASFSANIEAAARLGVEVATLDAGWFGPSEAGSAWHDLRGDWDQVNRLRFPDGIRPMADRAHARGMRFGLWCEIEGLGKQARLNVEHPDFPAARNGEPSGYVCFGNPAVQEWAFLVLTRLVQEYSCDWIKLDFNVDPQEGCNRLDHGHGGGDGLYEHILGYYRVLDRFRQAFPEVLLESCSSGGLRIDLGLMRHTHLTFLSDPDWPVHSLQVFWGASTLLAPEVCLHFSFSQWRGEGKPAQQNFDPLQVDLQPAQLDYYTRIAMLGGFGLSQKLPDLPGWAATRLAAQIKIYRDSIRRFVGGGDLSRLTGQPRRDGTGERWCAFQYSLPAGNEHLVFVFRLPGAEAERSIRLQGLEADRVYTLAGFDGEPEQHKLGRELMDDGLLVKHLIEESSQILLIR